MYLLRLCLLYLIIPYIIANEISILTDWNKATFQCMNNFFENTSHLNMYDTNVTIYELNENGGM